MICVRVAGLHDMNSKKAIWAGRIISGVGVFLMGLDAFVKLVASPEALEASAALGYTGKSVLMIGVLELIILVLYLIPRTAVLGAVLFTGYFGGAVATHVSHGNPLFTHMLSPVYAAIILWLGLWLRDERVRAINPLRSSEAIAQ